MYKKDMIEVANENITGNSSSNSLWNRIESEYFKSMDTNKKKVVDKDLKIIRIFISSTFKDFYNERDVLVNDVFPKLRKLCEEQGLYLHECDLRWGVPSDATSFESVSCCLDEIEKSRDETNNHNFFLCLIGERFGWVPSDESLLEQLKQKYDYIENSSVTLMEIIHGVLRSGTENGLFLLRSDNILKSIPQNHLHCFDEPDMTMKFNVKEQKKFIEKHFSKQGCVKNYEIEFQSITTDPISGKERIKFSNFETFSQIIEDYFKSQILNFKTVHNLSVSVEDQNEDMIHKSFLISTNKTSFKRPTYISTLNQQIIDIDTSENMTNPIILLTGEAGSGKSTIICNMIDNLKEQGQTNIFYHFCGASNMSHSMLNIIKRLKYYMESILKVSFDDQSQKDKKEELMLADLLIKNTSKIIIFIDAVDELWDMDVKKQIPKSTTKNTSLIISCLSGKTSNSICTTLQYTEYFTKVIKLQHMENSQLREIVTNYLKDFGKRLDVEQMNALLTFENAKNPLWLLSACEELRIYGDYSSLTKHIFSLPSTIADINKMIIKRLTEQDKSNVLKMLLQLLIVSRAGLWENLVKDILGVVLNYSEPISHSVWSEAVWKLKGFLQIQSIPLPLIKLRHRVMKESIEEQLVMVKSFRESLHLKISIFLESRFDDGGDMFLSDYVYHLVKCNARNRLIDFMRSKRSLVIIRQPYIRSKIMQSMRCINPVVEIPGQKSKELLICVFCSMQSSNYGPIKSSCFYCGQMVSNINDSKLYPCSFHRNMSTIFDNCAICKKIINGPHREPLKICQMCRSVGFDGKCGTIVKEEDNLFSQQLTFSNSLYNIETLI